MQREIATLVHPIFSYGLSMKNRLDKGEMLRMETVQAKCRELLLSPTESRRFMEYGGDIHTRGQSDAFESLGSNAPTDSFLGIRYLLVCWLDELFILHSSWENQWTESKLEASLYGSNDRAWKFWQQADLAAARPNKDSLEVCFLAVMLGFRGALLEEPEKLQEWWRSTRSILGTETRSWPHPPELEPPTNVPPLRGQAQFQKSLLICCVLWLITIPIGAFLLIQHLSN